MTCVSYIPIKLQKSTPVFCYLFIIRDLNSFLWLVVFMVLVRMTVTPAKAVCVPFIHQNVYLLRELVLIWTCLKYISYFFTLKTFGHFVFTWHMDCNSNHPVLFSSSVVPSTSSWGAVLCLRGDSGRCFDMIQVPSERFITALQSLAVALNYTLVLEVCFCIFFFSWLFLEVYGILVPPPGTEPSLTAGKVRSSNQWATREFLVLGCMYVKWAIFCFHVFK